MERCILSQKTLIDLVERKLFPAIKWSDIYIASETIASRDEQLFTFNISFKHEPHCSIS